MKIQSLLLLGIIECWSLVVVAQAPVSSALPSAPAKPSTHQAKKDPAHSAMQDPGERKFQENCSRCHNAPEDLSPRITGTVVQHMRVRASLSAADAREILRYLAP